MKQSYGKGVLLCLVATVSWGCMFPVMTSALRHIDAFTFTALRYSIALVAFTALLIRKEGIASLNLSGERKWLLWLFGSAGFAGFGFLVFLGQKLAGPHGALTASILMATMPMLGLLVNWALGKARPSGVTFAFISMSFLGVMLVLSKGHPTAILRSPGDYTANVPIVLGALCWVVYTVGASYFPKWSPIRYTAITTMFGLTTIYGVVFVLIVTGTIAPNLSETIKIWPHLLYMSLVAGFVGVLGWNTGNKIISTLNGVLFMDVVPLTAFTLSVCLGVIPVPAQVVGATVTAAALVFNNLYLRRRAKAAPMPPATPCKPIWCQTEVQQVGQD